MKKFILIGLVALLGIAAITNPSQEEHTAVIKSVAIEKMTERMEEELAGNMFAGLALALIPTIVENVVSTLPYDNYTLFSVVKTANDEHVMTYGVFGQIIPSDYVRNFNPNE